MNTIAKLSLVLGTFFSPLFVFAQIQFENISFEQALEKANQENKLIFVDAYAAWCGPCKWMDNNVFNKVEVGNVYNPQFVNLRINMETPQGKAFGKKYPVAAYPTFFYIDNKGNIVHQVKGAQEEKLFIAEAKKAERNYQRVASKEPAINYEKEAAKLSKLIASCFGKGLDDIFEADILDEVEKVTKLKDQERIEIYLEEMSINRKNRFNEQVKRAMDYTNNIGDCFKETTSNLQNLAQTYTTFDLCEMQQHIVAQLQKNKKQKALALWYNYYALNTQKS